MLSKYKKRVRVADLPTYIVKYFVHKNAKINSAEVNATAKEKFFAIIAQNLFTDSHRKVLNFVVRNAKVNRKKQKKQGYAGPVLLSLRQSLLG